MIPSRRSEAIFLALLTCLMWLSGTVFAQSRAKPPQPLEPMPSARRLAWQENELTLFVHFGMNTFTGRSTGLGNEDPNLFNPTEPAVGLSKSSRRINRFPATAPGAQHEFEPDNRNLER